MSAIYTNTAAATVYTAYSKNQMAVSSSLEKLSTGLRINRASDDASGLAISETLRANIKGTNAAIDVIANANNYINTADGFLQNVNDILGRMKELAVKQGDATLAPGDKTNIATEYNQLAGQITTNIAAQAKFNGQAIFDGNTRTFNVGADQNDTFTTNALPDLTALSFTASSNASDGQTELGEVQTAIDTITGDRAALGADQSQLNYISSGQASYATNVTAAESRIRDVDVAKETTNFSRSQILVQSSTAMLAQANQLPQSVLKLLQ